ncbi:MAG: hypothetical protein HYV07_32070 [Deltaproteobacteria bacterium]|nr:hypothetical protein [Deltaproteobacteria bacterium]
MIDEPRSPRGLALVLALSACALDRVDGAIVLDLEGLPSTADSIRVDVATGESRFLVRVPSAPRIDALSAIPVGPARLDIAALDGEDIVAEATGLRVDVERDVRTTLTVLLEPTVGLRVDDPADRSEHHVGDGDIPVVVTLLDPSVPTSIEVSAAGESIPMTPNSNGWVGSIPVSAAGVKLPAWVEVTFSAVARGRRTTLARRIRAHRSAWRAQLGPRPIAARVGADLLVVGDELGHLAFLSLATGTSSVERIALEPPIVGLAAITNGVIVRAGSGSLYRSEATALVKLDFDATGSTLPSTFGDRALIGRGRELIAIDGDSAPRRFAEVGGSLRAPPLVDAEGVVAADLGGRVVAFSSEGVVLGQAAVGESVLARPFRASRGELIAAGSLTGRVVALGSAGARELGTLSAPVVHTAVESLGSVWIAAGDVLFELEETPRATRVGAPITAPPVGLRGRVVVGVSDGRVLAVDRSGFRLWSAFDSAVTGLVPLEDQGRVLALMASGLVELIAPEELR